MMSPACKVAGSTSLDSTRSPAEKSVALMESDSTMKALYPNRLRSARSKVLTDTMVKIIMQTASATTSQTSTVLRICKAFFMGGSLLE